MSYESTEPVHPPIEPTQSEEIIPPPPPGGYPPPTHKTRRRIWYVLAALVLVVAIGGIVAVQTSHTPVAQVTSTRTPMSSLASPTYPPVPTITPTTELVWTTIQTFQDTGNKRTAVFNITANEWRMDWTCSLASGGGYFGVDVFYSDGTHLEYAVNTVCKDGGNQGQYEIAYGGMFYLDVTATVPWTINIQVLK